MPRRVVVKFGGADLSTGSKIRKAANMVKESGYEEIVVVVSAMGKTTDTLIGYLSEIGGVSDSSHSEIISSGELISARIFSSTLQSVSVESTYFDPHQRRWPIITDSNFKNAKPNFAETKSRIKRNLEPLLGRCVPVVCGFLGKDRSGHVTLLGRGGSDITATLIGNCLDADEVILVKETNGVLSADPNMVPDAEPLGKLSIEEMFSLAHGGAKIINARALKYKLPTQKLKVVSFSSDSLSETGTEITGVFKANSAEVSTHSGLTALTLIGTINPQNLSRLFSALGGNEIFGISTGESSVTVFLKAKNSKYVIRQLHDLRCFKAVSSREKVSVVKLLNPDFIDSPGWVAKISGSLAKKGINILEVTTSRAAINVFLDESSLEEALTVLTDL
jgi:aspartate kinase